MTLNNASHTSPHMPQPKQPLGAIGVLCGSLWLSACGGGGGDSPTPPAPPPPPPPAATALPDLDIVAPAQADLGTSVALSTSAVPASALKAQWDFGDGTGGTEAAPQHQFIRAGDLTIKLTLTNEAGAQKTYTKVISLTNKALVKGFYCSGDDAQGWCWMPPQASGNLIHDVKFADANTGWRVGELGEIFKTSDGGRTWVRQKSKTRAALDTLSVRSANDLLAVSQDSHSLLISQDGGSTWTQTHPPVDTGKFYTLGGGRALIIPESGNPQYLDGPGGTWQPGPLRLDYSMDTAGLDGSIVGYDGPGYFNNHISSVYYVGMPLQAARFVYPLPDIGGSSVLQLERSGEKTVWMVRAKPAANSSWSMYLYRSLNNGESWAAINLYWEPSTWLQFAAQGFGIPRLLTADNSASKVMLQPTRTGPLGKDNNPTYQPVGLWTSFDGGETWKHRASAGAGDTLDCSAWQTQILCESSTQLFSSNDFAETLSPVQKGAAYDSSTTRLKPAGAALTLTRRSETFVVSFDGSQWRPMYSVLSAFGSAPPSDRSATVPSFASRKIARRILNNTLWGTEDGGRSWLVLGRLISSNGKESLVLAEPPGSELSSVEMLDDRSMMLLGKSGKVAMSRDAGATWQRPAALNQSGLAIDLIHAQDSQRAWARGRDGTKVRLLITRDGGTTWTNIGFLPTAVDVLHVNMGAVQELTLADTRGQVFVSTDDGTSWSKTGGGAPVSITQLFIQGDKNYWAAANAGTLLKSTDKGTSWQKLTLPTAANLLATCFADDRHGWVSAQGGQMWSTSDGGATWRPQALPAVRDMTALNCQDSQTVWAAGSDGLLATGTGGD